MRTDRLLPDEPLDTLAAYEAAGGGATLRAAVEDDPDELISAVEEAGLRGRGGAGFPTGRKWRGVVDAAQESGAQLHFVANAAEGEPGTYKDRVLIQQRPFAFLEGLLLAMHATGATQAHVGIKQKFTTPLQRLRDALAEITEAGWPGAGSVAIVPGPDEYLFGEETGMLEVIEGKLPMPRIVKPYEVGLFATSTDPHPTVVNNVETLTHVTWIARHGAEAFREMGTEGSTGSMLFTVVGDVASPGVYELPLGTPLRVLLEDIAGADDIKAVYSGVSAGVITPAMLDLPLDFDAMQEAGAGLGSGGFMVYDTSRSIVDIAATLMHFLAIESCGQCNACKLGTGEIADLLARVQRGEGTQQDLETILKRASTVTDQNRCFLPVGAQSVIASTMKAYVDEFVATVQAGEPTPADVPVPLIDHIDEEAGEVTYHPRYHLKQPDWSYADQDPVEQRRRVVSSDLPSERPPHVQAASPGSSARSRGR